MTYYEKECLFVIKAFPRTCSDGNRNLLISNTQVK